MKKKVLKVIAFIIATAGVIFLLLLYNSFNGNFIAKEIATRHMKEYLKTHHTELDIADYEVSYNFKSGSYVMKIDVANSIDKDFRLSYRGDIGIQDDYDWMVLEKGNMQNRVAAFLNEERFEQPVFALVEKQDLDYIILQIKEEDKGVAYLSFYLEEDEDKEKVFPYAKIANDTPTETIVKTQPITLRIYVKSEAAQKKYQTKKIQKQCKQAYEKLGVHVVEVEIVYVNKP